MSRLDDLKIRRAAEGPAVSIYVRDNCIAAVGETQGSTGFMTDQGLAYLVWRDGQAFLAGKAGEIPATPEQVETIQQFSRDLAGALDK